MKTVNNAAFAGHSVFTQLGAFKDCHCERSEAIPEVWRLLRHFTPRNDNPTLREAEELQLFSKRWGVSHPSGEDNVREQPTSRT
jgi:hypothetical protein